MTPVRFVPLFLLFTGIGIGAEGEEKQESSRAPDWVHRVDVLESSETGRVFPWNVISATTFSGISAPVAGWRDLANVEESLLKEVAASPDRSANSSKRGPLFDSDFRENEKGESVPAFWEAVAPATYTLDFATPVVIHQIDLTPPLRKIGFSDFDILVRDATDSEYHPVSIREATTARGPTLDSGYHWRFRIESERALGLRLDFRKGTLDFPNRIFLKDLDIWGE